jgi:two-component system LytT family response regulator
MHRTFMSDISLTALVIDDEKLSRDYVHDLIQEFAPGFTILEAYSAKKGRPIIEDGSVDILFLDINMRETDGFGLLGSLSNRDFELVFVTAYGEHTIQAIREGAADYIMKPIDKEEFGKMLQRVTKKRLEAIEQQKVVSQSQRLKDEAYLDQKLTIHQHTGVKFIRLRDIVYLFATSGYTEIHLADGSSVTATKPIRRFEALLDSRWFFRIHKSYIIGLLHFREYVSENGDQIRMNNGELLPISRYRLQEFMAATARSFNALKL